MSKKEKKKKSKKIAPGTMVPDSASYVGSVGIAISPTQMQVSNAFQGLNAALNEEEDRIKKMEKEIAALKDDIAEIYLLLLPEEDDDKD